MIETVTMKGSTLHLKGNLLSEGKTMPDCELVNEKLESVNLSFFWNKPLLLLTVPSLDTDVCSKETHHFSEAFAQFKDKMNGVVVSMDLPFAQKRWCGATNSQNITPLSDYKKRELGEKFGVYIEELGLLARAVFIIDAQGVLRHRLLVREITEEPPYDKVFQWIQSFLSSRAPL